jgi:heme oxygenase
MLQEPVPADRIMHLLERFHGFHSTWEPALEGLVPEELLSPRLKLPLLRADLRSMGADESLLRALPSCSAAPSLCTDRASAAGSLYVLEGSSLGGLVIERVLARSPWYPAAGLRYWQPYGSDTGKRWKETLHYLEALPASWSEEVIGSANATFDLLQSWLRAHPHTEERCSRSRRIVGTITG